MSRKLCKKIKDKRREEVNTNSNTIHIFFSFSSHEQDIDLKKNNSKNTKHIIIIISNK
jgi:hypothetical protein